MREFWLKKLALVVLCLAFSNTAFATQKGETMQISLEVESEKIIITLDDNPATRDFYANLPLKLAFKDYVGEEKISPALPKRLNTKGLSGYEPQVGDLFYFAPWGNLGIFYNHKPDFHSGLVPFGKVSQSFLNKIKAQKDGFEILFERVK